MRANGLTNHDTNHLYNIGINDILKLFCRKSKLKLNIVKCNETQRGISSSTQDQALYAIVYQ